MEIRTGGRRSPDGAMMSRLDALADLRLVADLLGAFDCKLLEACVIRDQPWAITGRQHAVADTTARRWTIAALARLADALLRPPGSPPGSARLCRCFARSWWVERTHDRGCVR